jgi:hypothetical protein
MLVALSFTEGAAVPVPVRVTFCGEPVALSVMLKVPDSADAEAGLKATKSEHEAPAPRVAPQLPSSRKEVALVPPSAIEVSVTDTVDVFVIVTTCASLVVPTMVFGKAMEAGVTVRVGVVGAFPVPVKATEAGVLVPLLATTSVPVEATAAVGLNSIETVQLAATARVVPQVVADLRKGAETVSDVSVNAPVPVFLTVTTCTAEVEPKVTVPKASEVGASESVWVTTAVPVPVKATDAGVLVPLLATTSVPVDAAAAVGLNSTETVQDAPTARVVVQVVADLRKGAETVSEVSVNAPVPVFFTVTTCAAEVDPTVSDPNASEVGESESVWVTTAVPVPVKATDAGVLVPLLATTSVPVEAAAAVGLNSTETVQLAPTARVVVQVVADLRKGAETVSDVSVNAPVPVFLTELMLTVSSPKSLQRDLHAVRLKTASEILAAVLSIAPI